MSSQILGSSVEFKQVLLDAICEAFSSLGESPKQSIIFHLENTFDLKMSQYPNDVAGFDRALKDIFGPGAILLESLILSKLTDQAMRIQDDTKKQNFCSAIRQLNDVWQSNPLPG